MALGPQINFRTGETSFKSALELEFHYFIGICLNMHEQHPPPIDPHTPVMKQPFSPATSRNVAAPASTVSHHLEVYYEVHEMQASKMPLDASR